MRAMQPSRAAATVGILAAALLAGCAGTPARESPPERVTVPAPARAEPGAAAGDVRSPIVSLALAMVGVPYRYGGDHPQEGFDCSGLVYYSYTSNGHAVPRSSREQFAAAQKIALAEAAEGDLLFFQDQDKLSHVGIYLGERRFVHAPSSGGNVSVASIDSPYYQRHLVGVGRLLP